MVRLRSGTSPVLVQVVWTGNAGAIPLSAVRVTVVLARAIAFQGSLFSYFRRKLLR